VTERVDPVLLPGQVLTDATGQQCTGCGRAFGDGEKAIATRPSWPDTRKPVTWTCAACYVPPPRGRSERLTDDGGYHDASGRSVTPSW
jgi:hypothetical protein